MTGWPPSYKLPTLHYGHKQNILSEMSTPNRNADLFFRKCIHSHIKILHFFYLQISPGGIVAPHFHEEPLVSSHSGPAHKRCTGPPVHGSHSLLLFVPLQGWIRCLSQSKGFAPENAIYKKKKKKVTSGMFRMRTNNRKKYQ